MARVLLVAIAVGAVAVGIALNGPICYTVPQPKYAPCELRFPFEILVGTALAVVVITVLVRTARRP